MDKMMRHKNNISPNNLTGQDKSQYIPAEDENIHKTIFENALSGIYVVQDGKYCSINPLAASYTGYSQKELLGKKAYSIIHPEDRADVKRNIQDMLTGKRLKPYEYRIINKCNEICWLMGTATSILYKGKPATLANAMDITERKMAEKRLQVAENFYRTIFETTGTATIIIEEDMTISLINSEFEALTGYSKDAWEGKKNGRNMP